ncbi:hypothetical protein Q3G72_004535 [Acer saccharum]|nr:hypothetical protein Q3G72_004535 [Acer saccharum]
MSSWSDRWNPKGKLAWIDVFGVPVSYWEDSFFFKLGSLFGETLWIDEDSSSKARLDRGRFLALIPLEWPRKFTTKVSVEGRTFRRFEILQVYEEEDQEGTGREEVVKCQVVGNTRKIIDYPKGQYVRRKGKGKVGKLDTNASGFQYKGVQFQSSVAGEDLSEVDKGKKVWVRKSKPARLPTYYQKAVVIGKKANLVTTEESSSSTSFDYDNRERLLMQGESSSKFKQGGLLNGPGRITDTAHKECSNIIMDLTAQNGEDKQAQNNNMMGSSEDRSTRESKDSKEEDVAPNNKDGQNSASTEGTNPEIDIPPKTPKKRKWGKVGVPPRCHGMRTRNSKTRENRADQETGDGTSQDPPTTWNLAVEITKVIEDGMARGGLANLLKGGKGSEEDV